MATAKKSTKKSSTKKTTVKKTSKPKSTAVKQTFAALVLDESGSMSAMREAAVGLFNTQADAIRANASKGGTTKASFFKFGQSAAPHVCEVFHAQEPSKIPVLTKDNYVPQNGTPMRDGIGLAITRLEALDDKGPDTAFLVVVVTDGQENQSQEWSAERLRNKVNELQATGRWTFAVYGANISLADLAQTGIEIGAGNFGQYTPTAGGVAGASAALFVSTSSYFGERAMGSTGMSGRSGSRGFVGDVGDDSQGVVLSSTDDEDEDEVTP